MVRAVASLASKLFTVVVLLPSVTRPILPVELPSMRTLLAGTSLMLAAGAAKRRVTTVGQDEVAAADGGPIAHCIYR